MGDLSRTAAAMGEQTISLSGPSPPPKQQDPFKGSQHLPPVSVSSVRAESIQHTDNSSSKHREQSPATSYNDTPSSRKAETSSAVRTTSSPSPRPGGCVYETALVRGRRRMPYSLGIERLQKVNPAKVRSILPEHEVQLTKDINQLYNNLLPTQDVAQNRKRFVAKLEKIFKEEWPEHNIQINVFGSLGNMLCSNNSEVDICVTTDWKELENVCMVAELLAKRGMDKVVCVPAKVPIVKIRDPEFDIACHINVNNTLALETTRMIWTYVNIDTRVRTLAMVIKYWARRRMINDAAFGGTLSSYTWICMIIGFLQMQEPPVLPVLHQRPDDRRVTPNGNKSEFADDLDKLRGFGDGNKQTLGKLLYSFVKFYAHDFNYSMDALSIRLGGVIPKTKKWLRTVNNLLCIEEPFNTARNLANSADDISFRGLHLEFRRAFDLVSQAKLDECCEQYVFPKEEEKIWQKPVPIPRPVVIRNLSQQHSSRHRTRYSATNLRSSNNSMYQNNPTYSQASMQPGLNWRHPELQSFFDPGALSALQALQMQEQALRYQLAQQQENYGHPIAVAAGQIMGPDPFYVSQASLVIPETIFLGTPIMQPFPYLPESGVNGTWSQPQAAIQPPVYSAPQAPNSQLMPMHSGTNAVPSGGHQGNSISVPSFIADEAAEIGTPENAEALSRNINSSAIPSFIIDEDEQAQRNGKPDLKTANAEASNPSINLLQLLAARLTTRKPAPRTIASNAALFNSDNESTPNNPKAEEPTGNTTSTKTSGLHDTVSPGSTIGPQDTISISIGPSHDITHGTITSFRTKTTSLTLPTSATQPNSQGAEVKAEPVHAAQAQTQINEEELEVPQPSERADNQNIHSGTIAVASTVSADSMQLTPAQKINIVRRFSSMVSGRLAGLLSVEATSQLSNLGFLSQLEDLLKEFSNTVRSDTANRAHSLGCKSIRVLRREIARELERMLSSELLLPETIRHLPYIASEAERVYAGQMTFSEKVDGWVDSELLPGDSLQLGKTTSKVSGHGLYSTDIDAATILGPTSLDNISVSDSSDPSSFEVPGLYPDFINDGDISTYLANHTAFDDLVANVQILLEKYHCNKMDLIRHRVLDSVQRYQVQRGVHFTGNCHTAIFHIDWDVQEFLETQYADGVDQDLGLSLAFVGQLINAQLTTIEDYFGRVWPRYTYAVLNPLARKLRGFHEFPDASYQVDGTVSVGFDETEFTATGSEDFLVAVAQQLSWLAAACRTSELGLAYSHVDFTNTPQESSTEYPIFHIQVSVELPASAEQKGCWNTLAGSSILVASFPIPGRHHTERGLQSHLGILSSLVGIRQAVTYRGGYVLKGRFHALVPVDRKADSVQWHLIDTSPRKLRWSDIDKLCPTRVLGVEYKDLKALQAAKAFLGWCPRVKNILGTLAFDYTAVRYSKATISSKTRLNLSEFSFGVNKIVSASVKFTLGKKDGVYERDRSDYYEGILNDARDTHMFLYDSKERRTFHADAERVILQIILHAHNKSPYTIEGKLVCLTDLSTKLDGDDVRQTMLANANIILKQETRPKDSESLKLLFRDRVQQLYDTIHGFQGHSASNSTALSIESSTTIAGWEYLDLVSDKRSMKLKEVKLQKTCGHWPSFATDEDINGVILLGQDFGDIIQPIHASPTCTSYRSVPKGNDYLAIQTSTLIELFEEHGSAEDQQQLTSSGWTWHCPNLLFGACQSPSSEFMDCRCDRVQEFILPRSRFNPRQLLQPRVRKPGPLEGDGAVIFGSSGIKNSVIKRMGLVSRKSGTEPDCTASEVTMAATSSSTEVESVGKDDVLQTMWAKSSTDHQSPKCSPVSQWSVPEPGLPAAYEDSLCESETSSSSDASHSTIFSTSGLHSGVPKSNSTSIPERSEQETKTSGSSFTRPGVSFAAVAALPTFSPGKDTMDMTPGVVSLSVEKPERSQPRSETRSLHMATIWQPPDNQPLTTTQRPESRQVSHQLRTCNRREGINIGVSQDVDLSELLARPETAYKQTTHDNTMAWRHRRGDDQWGQKAQDASKQARLGVTEAACRQILRRKKNFIRQVT